MKTTELRNRFKYLKTMFHQAPLSNQEMSERFNKKMAEYLKANYKMFA